MYNITLEDIKKIKLDKNDKKYEFKKKVLDTLIKLKKG